MDKVKKPAKIYIRLFIAALAAYVIGQCALQVDILWRLGRLEHKLVHIQYGITCGTVK